MLEEERLKKEQKKLSKKIILKNDYEECSLIAGCDAVYTGKKIIYAMVVFDKDMSVKEKKYTVMNVKFPHSENYLSYRECPAAVETYHRLEVEPDLLMVSGPGIMHPMTLGVATHLGILLDKPAFGVSKDINYGQVFDDYVYDSNKKIIGALLRTKEHAKPIYISPGHRITVRKSLELAKNTLSDKKFPIPIHEAHKFANKVKKNLKEKGKAK